MPVYETVLVVKPQLSDAEIGGVLEKTRKLISGEGGEVLHEDRWGRRKLSYPIEQSREGSYVYLKFRAPPSVGARLDHHFRVHDSILRTLTLRQHERKARPVKVKKA